jgi:serine/threonine protein kinase
MTTVRVLGERYHLESPLGSGGAATVWLAHDVPGDRRVAVKLLDGGGDGDGAEARRERLRKEARLLATLDHPNVVRIHDVGDDGDQPYIVMEHVAGGSLADAVRAGGPMAPVDAVRVVLGVLGALEAAHQLGVVHRDVKPANVLLRADHTPVLCDFGIARTDADAQTRTGVALGSMGYMAPEQRVDARRAGPPADVYATACTLFNLVTADTPVDLYLASDSSPRWEAVPAPLRPALRHATRPEPSARPLSAAQFADELRALLPSLAGLAPVRPRFAEPAGYVPTRADAPSAAEPSLQERDRFVSSAEWTWADQTRRSRIGSQAVWVAVILVVVVTALATNVERLLVPAPPEAPPPVPPAHGRWVGAVDGWPAELELAPAPEGVAGTLVVHTDAGGRGDAAHRRPTRRRGGAVGRGHGRGVGRALGPHAGRAGG